MFVADHTGYKLLHTRCFQYSRDALTVLESFSEETTDLIRSVPASETARRTRFGKLMQQAGDCLERSWSLLKSESGMTLIRDWDGEQLSVTIQPKQLCAESWA